MSKEQGEFNNVLTLLDSYDCALSAMVSTYDDAMVSLSYLKFNNPYCPITTRGFKVTPALKRVDNQLHIAKQTDHKFTNPVDETEEEFQEQQRIEKQLEDEMRENKSIDVIKRFGNISQQNQIEETKKKFDRLVQLLLGMAKTAREIQKLNK